MSCGKLTRCYLPPGRGNISVPTSVEFGTWVSDPQRDARLSWPRGVICAWNVTNVTIFGSKQFYATEVRGDTLCLLTYIFIVNYLHYHWCLFIAFIVYCIVPLVCLVVIRYEMSRDSRYLLSHYELVSLSGTESAQCRETTFFKFAECLCL